MPFNQNSRTFVTCFSFVNNQFEAPKHNRHVFKRYPEIWVYCTNKSTFGYACRGRLHRVERRGWKRCLSWQMQRLGWGVQLIIDFIHFQLMSYQAAWKLIPTSAWNKSASKSKEEISHDDSCWAPCTRWLHRILLNQMSCRSLEHTPLHSLLIKCVINPWPCNQYNYFEPRELTWLQGVGMQQHPTGGSHSNKCLQANVIAPHVCRHFLFISTIEWSLTSLTATRIKISPLRVLLLGLLQNIAKQSSLTPPHI